MPPASSPPPTSEAVVDTLADQAAELAGQVSSGQLDRADAVGQLVEAAAGQRPALEEARNRFARRLHGRSGDLAATSALSLLNRALTASGWIDPYEWKHRRKP